MEIITRTPAEFAELEQQFKAALTTAQQNPSEAAALQVAELADQLVRSEVQ